MKENPGRPQWGFARRRQCRLLTFLRIVGEDFGANPFLHCSSCGCCGNSSYCKLMMTSKLEMVGWMNNQFSILCRALCHIVSPAPFTKVCVGELCTRAVVSKQTAG